MQRNLIRLFSLLAIVALISVVLWSWCTREVGQDSQALKILISPYQDLGLFVNAEPLGLEKKFKTEIEFVTVPWGDTYAAMLSASPVGDLAFASFPDFLIKSENLNKNTDDPLLFIYPAYIFRGGAFLTYNDEVPTLDASNVIDRNVVAKFFEYKVGFPHDTMYQYMVSYLANQNQIELRQEKLLNVDFDTAYLGTRSGDLDIGAVGLTQLTEAKKDGGRVVLNMDTLGFSDLMGFIAKKSTLEKRGPEINNAIKMWFISTSYVLEDIDNNSTHTLTYLKDKAATEYSIDSFKAALSQEYFPSNPDKIHDEVISEDGKYNFNRIADAINAYKGPPFDNLDFVKISETHEQIKDNK